MIDVDSQLELPERHSVAAETSRKLRNRAFLGAVALLSFVPESVTHDEKLILAGVGLLAIGTAAELVRTITAE